MEHWLQYLDHAGGTRRISSSIASLLLAGLTVTSGVLILTDKGEDKQAFSRIGLATIMFAYGAVSVGGAVGALAMPTSDEVRYQRWRSLSSSGPLDELTLAHLEGELEAEAEVAHRMRLYAGLQSIGLAVAGGAWIALGARGDLTKSIRISSYVGGGLLIAMGAWETVASFVFESDHERAYRLYKAGKLSFDTAAVKQVRVSPMFAAHGGGLSVAGQF